MAVQGDDAPALVVVDGSAKAYYAPPQLMMNTVYGLNKSFTKRVFLGLEIGLEGVAEVVIRLTGVDHVGVRFSPSAWKNFETSFVHIDKFFSTGRYNTDMLDQKIVGSGFSVRFTISHKDKAIEVEEDIKKPSDISVKKFKRSVVMKSATFDILKRYSSCIWAKIKHLESILDSWNICMIEIFKQAELKFIESKQGFEHPDGNLMSDPRFGDEQLRKLLELLREKDALELSMDEIRSIYNEVVYLNFLCNNFCQEIPAEAR